MKKFFIVVLIILLFEGGYFVYKNYFKEEVKIKEEVKVKKEVKKLKIYDEDSDERMIGVMINNNHAAWPHVGLDKSIINYEIIVEGGITRIMALYKGNLPEKIGSVRSSRPYFLDYILENDAIYVHWGGSDQAYSDMSSLNIDHIDGMKYESKYFYRDRAANKVYEHTGFTKGSLITEGINNLNYRNISETKPVFNYSVEEINLETKEDAIKADNIEIKYSSYHTTNYTYDEVNKVYLRSMAGKEHVDAVSGVQYTAKNIITYQVKNYSLDSKDRQELENIGSGEGYYITNGYAIPITWEKSSRNSKTIYKYKTTDEEIKLNDGNTWVQIQPKDKYLGITSNISEVEE